MSNIDNICITYLLDISYYLVISNTSSCHLFSEYISNFRYKLDFNGRSLCKGIEINLLNAVT